MDRFRYAATYSRHGATLVEYDSDLEDLVFACLWSERNGEQSTARYFTNVDGEWQPADVAAYVAEFRAEQEQESQARQHRDVERPWRLWIFGPDHVDSLFGRYETEPDARAASAELPEFLRPVVNMEATRPRKWDETSDAPVWGWAD